MQKFSSTLIFLFAVVSASLRAQTLEYLNANNINAGIARGASLFSSPYSPSSIPNSEGLYDLYLTPKDSLTSAIYTAALWMSGFDSSGGIHTAIQEYNQNGRDYWDGPIASVYDTAYSTYYGRVFKITRTQINQFQTLTFPASYSAIDSAILLWPSVGNPYVANNYGVNISSPLAPFFDANHDGIYTPTQGDYPLFCGDEAVFFVFNDARYAHTESGCPDALGVEVRGMAYSFADTNPSFTKSAVNNTVFVQYDIENKSSNNYVNFYLGLWEDPDLGCFDNDRVGCDTDRNLMFAYNGTVPDPDCGIEYGYGHTFISQGAIMLNQKMSSFLYFTNGAGFSDPTPSPCLGYRYLLTGSWDDGTPITYGGTGYNSADTTTTFCFPSDPNDTNGWSEISVAKSLPPGDRRMLGNTGPLNFNSGETKHFDFAFSTSYDKDTTTNMIKIVDTLKRDADIVQAYYDYQIVPCRNELIAMGVNNIASDNTAVFIYPNPANQQITIETSMPVEWLELTDMEGRLVNHQTASGTKNLLDISSFAKGGYLIKIMSNGRLTVKKIVID